MQLPIFSLQSNITAIFEYLGSLTQMVELARLCSPSKPPKSLPSWVEVDSGVVDWTGRLGKYCNPCALAFIQHLLSRSIIGFSCHPFGQFPQCPRRLSLHLMLYMVPTNPKCMHIIPAIHPSITIPVMPPSYLLKYLPTIGNWICP